MNPKLSKKLEKALPWVAGAGLAASHTLMSSNCSVPKSGQCTTCGSCSVVLVTLVSWALMKRDKNQENLYSVREDSDDS